MPDSPDDIENPSYYRSFAIEPLDFIEANDLGHHAATIITYVCRAGRKPGEPAVKDLRKARQYLDRLIRLEERSGQSPPGGLGHRA